MQMRQNILLIGSPGSGKGTFSALLKNQGYRILSMGEILRREVAKESDLGMRIKMNVNHGILIPDSLAVEIMTQEIQPYIYHEVPFAIEGFPSTVAQYEAFVEFLEDQRLKDTFRIIFLDCPEEVALERIISRLICKECSHIYNQETYPPQRNDICDKCGGVVYHRSEDTFEIGQRRIHNFKNMTLPIYELAKESFLCHTINSQDNLSNHLKLISQVD